MTHEQALEILRNGDSYRLIDALHAEHQSATKAAENYLQLVLDLYWKARDIHAVVAISQLGLAHSLGTAAAQPTDAAKLKDSAKKMAFNLAAFCWPGWDEPGIALADAEIRVGSDAAKLNLRLAIDLQRPPLGMSMAHWILGGYALTAGDFDTAINEFTQSVELAQQANDAGQVLLNQGFLALARIGAKGAEAQKELDRALASLEQTNTDDSKEYARQLRVVRKVCAL